MFEINPLWAPEEGGGAAAPRRPPRQKVVAFPPRRPPPPLLLELPPPLRSQRPIVVDCGMGPAMKVLLSPTSEMTTSMSWKSPRTLPQLLKPLLRP